MESHLTRYLYADESLKVKSFNLPSFQINATCIFDYSSASSHWVFKFGNMNHTDGPKCDMYCNGNPPFENDANLVMAWDGGHWSDSGATFKCVNGIYQLFLITPSFFY